MVAQGGENVAVLPKAGVFFREFRGGIHRFGDVFGWHEVFSRHLESKE